MLFITYFTELRSEQQPLGISVGERLLHAKDQKHIMPGEMHSVKLNSYTVILTLNNVAQLKNCNQSKDVTAWETIIHFQSFNLGNTYK